MAKVKPKPNTVQKPKAKTPPQPKKKPELVNAEYIAEIAGVTKRRVGQWKEEKIIQQTSRGLYEKDLTLAALFTWYRENIEKQKKPSDVLEAEKLRQITARATLEEIKVKRTKGDLHHTDDIVRVFGAIFSRIHASLESFPLGIAPLLTDNTDSMDIATKVKDRLDKILYEMTNFDFEIFKNIGGAGYIAQLEAEGETSDNEPD
jgi:phage terminase Nu1 subunit (DNA packaging protein)